jgi:hypothetical protein
MLPNSLYLSMAQMANFLFKKNSRPFQVCTTIQLENIYTWKGKKHSVYFKTISKPQRPALGTQSEASTRFWILFGRSRGVGAVPLHMGNFQKVRGRGDGSKRLLEASRNLRMQLSEVTWARLDGSESYHLVGVVVVVGGSNLMVTP